MPRVLIVEDSTMLSDIICKHLDKYTEFVYNVATTYDEAKILLTRYRYDFAITDLHLPDAHDGQIIALVNKHNISPIIFTGDLDEDFKEAFESANIVDYVLKERMDSIIYVVEKLIQIYQNRKKKVLIVDDSIIYRFHLKNNLAMHQFNIYEAENGERALKVIEENPDIELMITDYHMPIMDGLELVRKTRRIRSKKELAIIVLTSESNANTTSLFLKNGANDYITKPFSRDEFYARVYHNIESVDLFESMRKNFDDELINLLCEITESRSEETGLHIKRITKYTAILARSVGLLEDEALLISKMSALHDIGTVSTPDDILLKPGKLSDKEFNIVKKHPEAGLTLLMKAFQSEPKMGSTAMEIAYSHHERFDGTGYPQGLKGNEIPLSAQIVAVADVFDALVSKRVYKEAWTSDEAIEYIKENSGTQFNPKIVNAFVKNFDQILEVYFLYTIESERKSIYA